MPGKLIDLRRLSGIAIVEQKRASSPLSTRKEAVASLALRGDAVSDNISALAVGTVQELDNHDVTPLGWGLIGRSHIQEG